MAVYMYVSHGVINFLDHGDIYVCRSLVCRHVGTIHIYYTYTVLTYLLVDTALYMYICHSGTQTCVSR